MFNLNQKWSNSFKKIIISGEREMSETQGWLIIMWLGLITVTNLCSWITRKD